MPIVKINNGFTKQDFQIAEHLAFREKAEWNDFWEHFSNYLKNTVLFYDVDIDAVKISIMNRVKYKYYKKNDDLKVETVNKIFEKYKDEIPMIKESITNLKKTNNFSYLDFSLNDDEVFK